MRPGAGPAGPDHRRRHLWHRLCPGQGPAGSGVPSASRRRRLPLFGPAKWLATALSSVSGIPGGIFSPSLAVGAGLGAELGHLLPGANAEVAVLVGMVAYFAGVVQAPITAFVIVLEMTGNHAMAVPIMAGSLIGCGAARVMGAEAVYHALSHGFLDRAHKAIAARGPSAAR
ncbi:chloride channel protein [Nitrospirillum sp. BR 11164]|uniref:chloride channel protein n=1 Tax=Nitrospirillum sp. BR 11164 TaxID=3104324 RepID=UPI002AFE1502|nr:chloride channel protein [Nitrospirillum sp. BR 11164]MEA1651789.1 chloride channel protein [Nitrospirillum sp. BR 11164]